MTIFDAVTAISIRVARNNSLTLDEFEDTVMNLQTVKAISLEDLRAEIEGMKKEITEADWKDVDIAVYKGDYNQALSDLLKKLEDK